MEKKVARRAASNEGKENTPRPMLPAAIASPLTGTVPMPGVPMMSLVPVSFVKSAEAQPVATVAPMPGSLLRL